LASHSARTPARGFISVLPIFAVLVFPGQEFDPPRFADAAQLFGKIVPEQFSNYRLPEYQLVSSLSNRDLEQTGTRHAVRGEDFHTDHSNYAVPPKATQTGRLRRDPGRLLRLCARTGVLRGGRAADDVSGRFTGLSLSFIDPRAPELEFFGEAVLPMMFQAGLRV
jgi:hypothetical protein